MFTDSGKQIFEALINTDSLLICGVMFYFSNSRWRGSNASGPPPPMDTRFCKLITQRWKQWKSICPVF